MEDNVFSKIIAGEIPCDKVFENDEIIAFHDINPRAKHHILIVPKKYIPTIKDLDESAGDDALVGRMIIVARNIAKDLGLEGYKLAFNVGASAGQIVFHIHLHLMSDG